MSKLVAIRVHIGTHLTIKAAPPHDKISGDTDWDGNPQTVNNDTPFIFEYGKCTPVAFMRHKNAPIVVQFQFTKPDGAGRDLASAELVLGPFKNYHSRDYSDSRSIATIRGCTLTENDLITFSWTVDSNVPVGVFGPCQMTLDLGVERIALVNTLEFYLLPVTELPEVFHINRNPQVPLLLLRMFVLAQQVISDNKTPESWVKTCTNLVHGTARPFDGQLQETINHWLAYNIVNGATSFSQAYGASGFNVGLWLDAYRVWTMDKSELQKINCYDQAAATEYALCLGIPHTQINWEYHKVYGFINASLVGWGLVNSPYPGEVKDLLLPLDDPKRTPFENHAYLSWSADSISAEQYQEYNLTMRELESREDYQREAAAFEAKYSLKLKMIDACAGPTVGDTSRFDYEKRITPVGDPEKSPYTCVKADPEKYTGETHYLGSGISNLDRELSWLKQLSPAQQIAFKTNKQKFLNMLVVPDGSSHLVAMPFAGLPGVVKSFSEFVVEKGWKYENIPVRDYVTAEGTTVSEVKYSYALEADQPKIFTASMRVAVSNEYYEKGDNTEPRRGCANHMAYLIVTGEEEFKDGGIIEATDRRGIVYRVPLPGSTYRRAFAWQNVAVEVYITPEDVWNSANSCVKQLMERLLWDVINHQKFPRDE